MNSLLKLIKWAISLAEASSPTIRLRMVPLLWLSLAVSSMTLLPELTVQLRRRTQLDFRLQTPLSPLRWPTVITRRADVENYTRLLLLNSRWRE